MSLEEGTIPQAWKIANIIPIYKKGLHSNPLNYRPVSLTSVCSKTMERLIAKELMNYLEINNILSKYQFGFRPSRSVLDLHLLMYDFITLEYDKGNIV